MNAETNKSKLLINLTYLYITLPFIIFVIGWIKWYYAIIFIFFITISLVKIMKSTDSIWVPSFNKINILKSLIIIIFISIIVYLSGIGNFVWQNSDHEYRNSIFRILVEDKWPLINYEWNSKGSGLIYYIGFWLPAAVVGKITNLQFGYYFQIVWAIIGIFFTYYLICTLYKKIIIWPLIILMFFSGLDIVGYITTSNGLNNLSFITHLEWWAGKYQYSSIITQLFWVFNQAIPTWCITMLLYAQNNSKNAIFLLSLSMLSSTLPFIGLIPYVIYVTLVKSEVDFHKITKTNIIYKLKKIIKQAFTFQNFIGGGIIGITSFLYLKGNSAGQYVENLVAKLNIINILIYYLFCFLEFGIYLLIIKKYQSRNSLFYFVLISLCIIPLIRVGTSADFCMRASIPALLLLILLIIDTIIKAYKKKDFITIKILLFVLIIGSVTSLLEINRTLYRTYDLIKQYGEIVNEEVNKKDVYTGINFSGDIEENLFFEYLAK